MSIVPGAIALFVRGKRILAWNPPTEAGYIDRIRLIYLKNPTVRVFLHSDVHGYELGFVRGIMMSFGLSFMSSHFPLPSDVGNGLRAIMLAREEAQWV